MTFGIISTIDKNNFPNSTGIWYVLSPPKSKLSLYMITSLETKKIRNIKINPNISFIIPFPHHILRIVPSSTVEFRGKAEIISIRDEEAKNCYVKKRLLRSSYNKIFENSTENEINKLIFIKLIPNDKILAYGVGISLYEMRKDHAIGVYSVNIPKNRL